MKRESYNRLIEVFYQFGRLKPFLPRTQNLSQGEFFMLRTISCCPYCKEEGVRISALRDQMRMTLPAVSQMLNSLENKNLIRRCVDCGDHRGVFVSLTQKGKQCMQDVMCRMEYMLQQVESRMGKEDVEQFIEISSRLFSVMQEIKEQETISAENGDMCL